MKKIISAAAAVLMAASLVLGGCGTSQGGGAGESGSPKTSASETESTKEETDASLASSSEGESCQAAIRVGALKGPTSMGLVELMDRAQKGETSNTYEFTMAGAADELVGKIANGDLDIALVPANVASVLYSKTQQNVAVVDINTLGVLYAVTSDRSVASVANLKGKTVYMTGKGTTPEFVVSYLLAENGLNQADVDLQFKSEATEVASILAQDPEAVGILPQPFATAACIQNGALKQAVDLTEEWNRLNEDSGSMLVTGVTLVRRDFLRENGPAVDLFVEDHRQSTDFANQNVEEAAALVAEAGIVEKAPIAQKALPQCNIVCITGQEMKDALSGYLNVLYEQDAKSVGGQLPGEDFYYIP